MNRQVLVFSVPQDPSESRHYIGTLESQGGCFTIDGDLSTPFFWDGCDCLDLAFDGYEPPDGGWEKWESFLAGEERYERTCGLPQTIRPHFGSSLDSDSCLELVTAPAAVSYRGEYFTRLEFPRADRVVSAAAGRLNGAALRYAHVWVGPEAGIHLILTGHPGRAEVVGELPAYLSRELADVGALAGPSSIKVWLETIRLGPHGEYQMYVGIQCAWPEGHVPFSRLRTPAVAGEAIGA